MSYEHDDDVQWLSQAVPNFILGISGQIELCVNGNIVQPNMQLRALPAAATIDVIANLGMW